MSMRFLVPPDYEAVFSGLQTLRAFDSLRASNDLPLVQLLPGASIQEERDAPEELSPEFSRVLSGTKEPLEDQPKPLLEEADSAQLSDSDLEFFDCRQGLSDSDPEDAQLQPHAYCRVSEPPSPMPASAPDDGGPKRGRQCGTHLRVHAYEHGESLGEFPSDWEAEAPAYQELPSRDPAGYCDEDGDDEEDFLGRVRGGA